MEVELRPDIKVTLNGTEQTFRNAAGKTVYPLVLRECVYLPVRNIGELCGKSVLWHSNPDGTMETLYLYDPPTDGQIQEAQAYLDRFDRELTAMEQALTAMQAKTIWSEEELRAEMESKFETPLAALTELTAPALGPVNGLMEGLRLRARDLLTNTVRPRIQPEEHMSPGAAAEYLQRDWQSHRDEFVPNVDKQLGWIEEQWQECRELLDAVIGNETPAAAQPSPQVVVKAVDGAKVRHIAGMVQIDLSGQSNQKIDSFAVSRGYGYWKIYVVNEGSAGLYVRITDDTGETLYRSETVAPGEAYSFASTTPLEEGSYYLLIHSADGGKALRGFLAYRQESRYQDLPA